MELRKIILAVLLPMSFGYAQRVSADLDSSLVQMSFEAWASRGTALALHVRGLESQCIGDRCFCNILRLSIYKAFEDYPHIYEAFFNGSPRITSTDSCQAFAKRNPAGFVRGLQLTPESKRALDEWNAGGAEPSQIQYEPFASKEILDGGLLREIDKEARQLIGEHEILPTDDGDSYIIQGTDAMESYFYSLQFVPLSSDSFALRLEETLRSLLKDSRAHNKTLEPTP